VVFSPEGVIKKSLPNIEPNKIVGNRRLITQEEFEAIAEKTPWTPQAERLWWRIVEDAKKLYADDPEVVNPPHLNADAL